LLSPEARRRPGTRADRRSIGLRDPAFIGAVKIRPAAARSVLCRCVVEDTAVDHYFEASRDRIWRCFDVVDV